MEESKEDFLAEKKQKFLRKLTEDEQIELYEAIVDEDYERAKELIGIMENVNAEICYDHERITVLEHASYEGRIELVKYLFELGADEILHEKENGGYVLSIAVSSGNIEIVQMFLNAGVNINHTNIFLESALSEAAWSGYDDIFELLISSGVDLEICGGKALIEASTFQRLNLVERLIELQVDVNYFSSNGWTALFCACRENHLGIVMLLMSSGADETIKTSNGETAIEVTTSEEIKEFIRNYKPTKYVLK